MRKLSSHLALAFFLILLVTVSQQNSQVGATSLAATIATRDWTAAISVDPTEDYAYVATTGSWIEKIDLSTFEIVGSLYTDPHGGLRDIVVSGDGLFAYTSSWSTNKVLQIDLATLTISALYSVGVRPRGITITADSRYVYVANTESNSISKIDTTTSVVTSISVGDIPYDVSTDNNENVYVVDAGGQISQVSVTSNAVVLTRTVGQWMTDVVINTATGYAYALQYSGGNAPIYKIRLTDLVKVSEVAVASGGVFVPANGLYVYTGLGMVRASDMQVLANFDICTGINSCNKASGVAVFGSTSTSEGFMLGSLFHAISTTGYHKIRKVDVSLSQSITFSNPGNWAVHQPESRLFATASSGMAVTFSSNTENICQVYNSGGQRIRAISLGTCSITASRTASTPGGSNYWNAAESVTQSFEIEASAQAITFNNPGDQSSGTRSVALSATATSGLQTFFESLTPTICYVLSEGNVSRAVMAQVGDCSIRASQDGDWGWNQASQVTRVFNFASSPQTITFTKIGDHSVPAPLNILSGKKNAALVASASSGLPVSFTSPTTQICTVSGSIVTFVSTGDCTIIATQDGGSGWEPAAQVTRTFTILPSPPTGEIGVSIDGGDSFTNSKNVVLNLVWPEYATEARISNDGGFSPSKTTTVDLSPNVKWELDDTAKGVFTKVVYVRFSGIGDNSRSYTDDIVLDTTAPTIDSSDITAGPDSIELNLKATDDITGVDEVQIKSGLTTVTKDYKTKIIVTEKELGLNISSLMVSKSANNSIEIRVSDKAGNWSVYKQLAMLGTTKVESISSPRVLIARLTSSKSLASMAKLVISKTSKVSLKVSPKSARFCKVSGSSIKGLKVGTCRVTILVKPKKGVTMSRTVSFQVTK
jgi:YVTN family beta-propeller protein